MKDIYLVLLCCLFLGTVSQANATDLKRAKVTQVVNDVQVISGASQTEKNAVVNDVLAMPDILRTGAASRAELVAEDETVTRVGANTIFSFDAASRTIDLKQGSLLFHSPHGKGGGAIHTGSATASVLGSTLMVSATPNGGFKVISLEDGVQIKLANGLHQHLEPGQMTFILPGGNHLAPIVYFRMDELSSHSLLINGFKKPLPSLSLIDHEINKQKKLIKSGRLRDTGLLAGNNATPNQVEVLDPNTVQTTDNTPNVKKALASDATINTSSLTDRKIPTPPTRIFFNPSFKLANNPYFANQTFRGFAALDIYFNTPGVNAPTVDVNMKNYANKPEFDFVAAQEIYFEGSVAFSGLTANNLLTFVAGNHMVFQPGISFTANVGDLEFITPALSTVDGVTFNNSLGNIGITSGDTLNLNNVAFNLSESGQLTLTAPNAINLTWDTGANNGTPANTTLVTDAATGRVSLNSASGSLNVTGTSIQAHYLTLTATDGILLDGAGQSFTATGAGSTISLNGSISSPATVTVQNADLSNFSVVNIAANTITINKVTFASGSIENFATANGRVNVNGSRISGGLNIYNSFYGLTPITSVTQVTVTTVPGTTPGIYSYGTGSGCHSHENDSEGVNDNLVRKPLGHKSANLKLAAKSNFKIFANKK
ncbi:MAG: FecR family protein [Verrucomicrobiae bacterium]